MKSREFWKRNILLWIMLLAIQIIGFTSVEAVYAQPAAGTTETEPTRILVIETTDMHGWLLDSSSGDPDTFRYRLAYISNAINEARQSGEYDDVILLDGGDIYQGPPISNLTYGAAMRAAMDAMNYDAVSLGNHEFDWDVTRYCADDKGTVAPYELGDYSGDPDIPVLASDLFDAATGERVPFTKDYVVLEKAGRRIAVVGYIPDFSIDVRTEKIAPYVIEDDPERLNDLLGEINEREKPDATLVLAHEQPVLVAERIDSSRADLVLGGHSHDVVAEISSNGIPCLQGNKYAEGYASAVLEIGSDGSVSVEDIVYTDITEYGDLLLDTEENRQYLDETILDISYIAWNSVWESMSEVLGYTDTPIKKKKKKGVSTAGNWVTGLMIRATEESGTQIAFYNNGGIRTSFDIPEGSDIRQITINDIYTMLPFGNRFLIYDLTGPELARQLADGLKESNYGDEVSGLTFTYSVSGDPDMSEEQEYIIRSITLDDGTEVDLEDTETTYRVCISNFNATIPGSVFEQKEPVIPEAEAPVDAEALIMAIRALSEENDGYLPVDTGVRGVEYFVTVAVTGVSGSFNDRIRLNYYFNVPDAVFYDEKAYVTITNENTGKGITLPVNEAQYYDEKGYRFSIPLAAKEANDTIVARIYDGEGNAQILVGASNGRDYTETGVRYSLMQYLNWLAAGGTTDKERAVGAAAKDYCTAAQIYFGYGADGLSVSSAVSNMPEEDLNDLKSYIAVREGTLPTGVSIKGISAMFESDNRLRLYLSFRDVDPEDFTYAIDGSPASLMQRSDGEYYLAFHQGAFSNHLQDTHTYSVSDGTNTYSVTASVLTYARSCVIKSNGTDAAKNLGRALYLYNRAAVAAFD